MAKCITVFPQSLKQNILCLLQTTTNHGESEIEILSDNWTNRFLKSSMLILKKLFVDHIINKIQQNPHYV